MNYLLAPLSTGSEFSVGTTMSIVSSFSVERPGEDWLLQVGRRLSRSATCPNR
jgi:hypothetical protein